VNEETADKDELKLAPTDPDVDATRRQHKLAQIPVRPLMESPARQKLQFGVFHLLVGTTVVAGAAAMLQWFDAGVIAMALGFVALFFLIAMGIVQVTHPSIRFAWWCLLGLYLFFVLIAIFVR
jgi:hypothetical protein